MHRIWSWGIRRPVCPGIRKPASDGRPGQIGLQQLLVLSIHVNHGQNIDPRRGSGVPPTDQSLPGGSASAVPLQGGVIAPGSAGVPPASFFLMGSLSISATLRAATTLAGTATARPRESQGAVAGRSKWRSCPRLCHALCGRDARAPRRPQTPGPPRAKDFTLPPIGICRTIGRERGGAPGFGLPAPAPSRERGDTR